MNAPLAAIPTARPSHWHTPPIADARTYLPLARRGIPARGHDLTDEAHCKVCRAPAAPSAVVPPAPALKPARKRVQAVARFLRRDDLARIVAAGLDGLTHREVILVAVARLSIESSDVDALDLVVAAWSLTPASFGFTRNGVNYPHTNKVLAKLSGDDGLVGVGWLVSVRDSTYHVTERGRAAVLALAAGRASR